MRYILSLICVGFISFTLSYGYVKLSKQYTSSFDDARLEFLYLEPKDLIVFTATDCSASKELRRYLDEYRIVYIEKLIDLDENAERTFKKMKFTKTPTLVSRKGYFEGYSPENISQIIKELKYD